MSEAEDAVGGGLSPGWTASTYRTFLTSTVVDPAGPVPPGLIAPSRRRTRVPTEEEMRNAIGVVHGDLMLRDGAGVLRLILHPDHDSLVVVNILLPETACAAAVGEPLGRVVGLPFDHATDVFVRSATPLGPGHMAPCTYLTLSRPLWGDDGVVPFPCEDLRGWTR